MDKTEKMLDLKLKLIEFKFRKDNTVLKLAVSILAAFVTFVLATPV